MPGTYLSPPVSVNLGAIPASADIVYLMPTGIPPDGLPVVPGGGFSHIWVMDDDGSNATQLTFDTSRNYEHVAVSFDRHYIVANRPDPTNAKGSVTYLFDLQNATEQIVAPDFHSLGGGGIDISVDGYIYGGCHEVQAGTDTSGFANSLDICKIALDGSTLTKLNLINDGDVEADVAPNWPGVGGLNTAHDIAVANVDGTGSLLRLTEPGSISIIPNWQGDRIVYMEMSDTDDWWGASIVNDHDPDQAPLRIKQYAVTPKWIPQASAGDLAGLIVYQAADTNGSVQMFSTDPQGGQRRQLTDSEGNNSFPAWSFDGEQIAFASSRTGKFEIWVMDADGGNELQLTRLPADADEMSQARWSNGVPSWSPDNSRIAFSSARSGQTEIWAMNADGGDQLQLTTTPGADSQGSNAPSWSPDESQIAFASNRSGTFQTYVMDADGGNVRQLTQSLSPDFPDANVPVWSPDGSKIAFWSGIESQHGEIWVMDADGSNRLQLTDGPGQHNSDNPAWSPDGRYIIFETGRSGVRVETWIMNADGSNERLLLPFGYGGGRLPWQLISPVPEPATPILCILGLFGMVGLSRRYRR